MTTCAVITTGANSLMKSVHDRMPAILTPDSAATWLDPDNRHPEDLLKPFPVEALEMWEVGTAVGNPRNDTPGLVELVRLL